MKPLGLAAFERLAGSGDVVDEWGRSTLRLPLPPENQDITALMHPGLDVIIRVGPDSVPLTVSAVSPAASELDELVDLAGNEREAAEIRSATSPLDVLRILGHHAVEVEVRLNAPSWVRTEEALARAVERNWVHVASSISATVGIGDDILNLERLASPHAPSAALPCYELVSDDGPSPATQGVLERLADATAWTQIAHTIERDGRRVLVTLHDAHAKAIEVNPDNARGGAAALRWLAATDDPNRMDALRQILRIATLNSADQLPDGVAVQKLAERQRIALSQDRAAEVQRAVADGQKATTAALEGAAQALGEALDDATKTTTTAALAVLGLIAFLVKEATSTPDAVVVGAAVVAVVGVALVAAARWTMLGDRQRAISHLQQRLRGDPLLPRQEYDVLAKQIADFDVDRRVLVARAQIAGVAAIAACLTVGATWWVVSRDKVEASRRATPPATTTTTVAATTTSVTSTTVPPSATSQP